MSSRATMFSCFILQDKRTNNYQPRLLTFFFFPGFSFSFSGPNASLSTHKETCLASCCCCSDPTHTHSHSAALICACAVENQADDVCVHGRNEELLYVCVFVRACVFETERGGGGGGGGGGMWRVEDSWRMLINES